MIFFQVYIARGNQNLAEYKRQMQELKSSDNPKVKEMLAKVEEDKIAKSLKKAIRARKKVMEEAGKPVRPSHAFLLFSSETISGDFPHEKISNSIKRVGAIWRDMDEAAREPYVKRAEKNLETYKLDMAKWEAMLEKNAEMKSKVDKANEAVKLLQKKKAELGATEE